MKPAAWTTLGGKSVKIYRARPFDVSDGSPEPAITSTPGTLRIDGGHLLVRGEDGWLELLSLQAEGKKAMDGAAFARGLHLEAEGHFC